MLRLKLSIKRNIFYMHLLRSVIICFCTFSTCHSVFLSVSLNLCPSCQIHYLNRYVHLHKSVACSFLGRLSVRYQEEFSFSGPQTHFYGSKSLRVYIYIVNIAIILIKNMTLVLEVDISFYIFLSTLLNLYLNNITKVIVKI